MLDIGVCHTYIKHKHTHTQTRTHIHACIHTYIYAHIKACMHATMYASMGARTHAHTFMHTYIPTYLPTTYVHTYIHTYIHSFIHSFILQIQTPVTGQLDVKQVTEQLNMHRIAAKFVPRVLTHDQNDSRVAMSGTERNCDKRSHTPLERHHRRWKHRLCLRPRDKTAIFAVNPGSLRRKKNVCKKANWRRCSFVSLTKRGLYTGILSHLEWRSIQTSTVIF